ncbi:MAG TPA: CHAT domain-containing protein, partial [Thermomicrobiales bacterium]|nr:CHAT domain-containing protein [Thermomicrobiales bacterium]
LNSCDGAQGSKADVFSSTAATLIRCGIPAVLAMQHEISDDAAIEFARTFYDAIGDGAPIDSAVADARLAISIGLRGSVEWGTPVLHMRAPDGVLFRVERPSGSTPPPESPAEPVQLREPLVPSTPSPEPLADPVPPVTLMPQTTPVPPDPTKRELAAFYLAHVRGRLQQAGFAIQERVVSGGYEFDCVARAASVGPLNARVGARETVVILERFGTVNPVSLGAFARVAAAWAETTRVSGSFGTLFCAPVAVVDSIDQDAAPAIVNDKPIVFRRLPAANLVLPVVYDLGTQSFYSPIGTTALDSVIWPGFRKMVQNLLLLPPRPTDLPPAGMQPAARPLIQPLLGRPSLQPPPDLPEERKPPPKPPDLPP